MDMQPVSRVGAEPLTILSQHPAFRVVAQGTTDILSLLNDPARRTTIVELFCGLIEQERGAPACHGLLDRLVAPIHAGDADDPRIHQAFDGALQDLADLPDDVLQYLCFPPRDFVPVGMLSHWVRRWMPPTLVDGRSSLELDLGIEAVALGDRLDSIRHDDDEAFRLLMAARLREALGLNRPFGALTLEESIQLVGWLARLLALVVACLRVALLRRWSRQPMAHPFQYGCDRPSLARTMMSALIEPARDMLPILALHSGPDSCSDLPLYLARTRLNDPAFVAIVEEISHRCFGMGSGRLDYDDAMARLQAKLHALVAPVARTTFAELQKQGLGKLDFVEDRLGLSASHATVIIARSLLDAGKTIDACIAAVRRGDAMPASRPLDFRLSPKGVSKNALRRVTSHLRRTIRPDQESEKLGHPKIEIEAIAKNDRTGFKLVDKALYRFARSRPDKAIATLSIDPSVWFR